MILYRARIPFLLLWLIVGGLLTLTAQDEELPISTEPSAAFLAYRCEFLPESNQVRVYSVLLGANGALIPAADVSLTVQETGSGTPLLASDVQLETLSSRPPLQLIVVLDTTETVPLDEVTQVLTTQLLQRLPVDDEVALVTFSQEVLPSTQFYTDKNRLVNEHLKDLLTLEGDNRLYYAMLRGVSGFPIDPARRKVVLVLTDSGRRESDDTPIADIIERAQSNNVQVFPLAFYTLDMPTPIRADMFTIAQQTGGYAWFHDVPYTNRSVLGEAIRDYLNEFLQLLSEEYVITVDLQSLPAQERETLALTLIASTANDGELQTSIRCPIEQLNHSIAFIDAFDGRTVRGPVDIGVTVESDYAEDVTRVRFILNDEFVQEGTQTTYTFDPRTMPPGAYTLYAQLLDNEANVLAETARSRVFSQLELSLVAEGTPGNVNGANLRGAIDLVLSLPEGLEAELPQADFLAALASDPEEERLLGTVAFREDGRAVLSLSDILAAVQQVFPDAEAGTPVLLSAQVPSIVIGDPLLALAEVVRVNVLSAPQAAVPQTSAAAPEEPAEEPEPEPPEPSNTLPILLLILGIVLFLLNLILFNAVRRARVRYLITHPDNYEFGPQMMTITVYREGTSQSHSLTKRTLFIGRGSSNDINLGSDSRISRNHGVVLWRRGRWYYTNRKGRIAARIDGRRRRGFIWHRLKPFTEIEIGNALLVFHDSVQQDVADFVKTEL